jgi:uncharacterized protein YjcR
MAKPDLEAIESAYRAGLMSVRAIGEKHGVNYATILKRANKEGWRRYLTEQVRTATKAKVTGIDNDNEPVETVVVDLLADLMHLFSETRMDF